MQLRTAAAALAAVLLTLPGAAAGYGVALRTAIDTTPADGAYEQGVLSHTRASGAQLLKLGVDWNQIAPSTPPTGFEASNPDSPGYKWSELDKETADAVAEGLTPFFTVVGAPSWAQSPPGSGETRPDPAQLASFASAVATRYDGSHDGLPWVRYYEVWNEPNASFFLQPQMQGSRMVSVETYRTMIDDFATAVHGVRSDDQVIAGALFPNALRRRTVRAISALEFTRRLLCMSAGAHPERTCPSTVEADVWSVHPYTTGGPSTQSVNPDNVWIYNLGALTSLVKAAQRAGTLVSSQPVQTWVTEFGWASTPPASRGVSPPLLQRWVAESLYRAWRAGIGIFTWYALFDEPSATVPEQAGLYYYCSRGLTCAAPKPAQRAFRFPFVAFRSGSRSVLVWGRTPAGVQSRVSIQWRSGSRWRTLTTLRTDGDGIFTATRRLPRSLNPTKGVLRATIGESSPSFSLRQPPDVIVTPFGT
ncbi:MAG TPA: hypothetical protein VHU13_01825 [Solirubrobacteraceae bacterium]|jgi:hypothetical protein|nr:hypothetical protein [Solirubrobacteraceae bacterium]